MKTYKPTMVEHYHCDHRECDICGMVAELGKNWGEDRRLVDETEVRCSLADSWPDDVSSTASCEIDVCPVCFVEKLIPWVNSFREGKKLIESDPEWLRNYKERG